jgi:asparaginyl-tRNA synthetase
MGGKTITVGGWVRSVRDMKNFGFVVLNDGSCFKDLQVVMRREQGEEGEPALSNYDEICSVGSGAALLISGTLVLTPERPQPFELQAQEIVVEGPCAEDYPLQKQRQPRSFCVPNSICAAVPTCSVRSPRPLLCAFAIHCFFQEHGFVYVHTPILRLRCEGGRAEMFR